MEQEITEATEENLEANPNNPKLHARIKKYVNCFVVSFEKKIKDYSAEIKPGTETKKAGKLVDGLANVASTGVAATVGAILGYLALPLLKPIKLATKAISDSGLGYFGKRNHRIKAKNCINATSSLQENKDAARRILVEAGLEIFLNFVNQFMLITDAEDNWIRGLDKLAKDAVSRTMNYFDANPEQDKITRALLSKAVIEGESKEGYGAMLGWSEPGHTLKLGNLEIKSSEFYTRIGIAKIENEVRKYYEPKYHIEALGYRQAFEWEDDLKERYKISKNPPKRNHEYVMQEKEKEAFVSDILKSFDDKDQMKQLKKTNESVSDTHQNVNEIQGKINVLVETVNISLNRNQDNGSILFNLREPVSSFKKIRLQELQHLHELVQQSSENVTSVTSRITSVHGAEGVGKTQLVRKYIHEFCGDYKNILWMDAKDYETLAKSFFALAGDKRVKVSLKDSNGKEKDIRTVVDEIYRFFASSKSLFIFDAATKYSIKDSSHKEKNTGVVTFTPSNLKELEVKPCFIISSCNLEWPEGVKKMELKIFTQEDARAFISEALQGVEIEEINKLTETLGYFPLTLQRVVEYIRDTNAKLKVTGGTFGISDYLKKYEEEPEKLQMFENAEDSNDG